VPLPLRIRLPDLMGANRGTEYRSLDGKMMDTEPAAFAIVLKGLPDFLFFQAVLQNLGISRSYLK